MGNYYKIAANISTALEQKLLDKSNELIRGGLADTELHSYLQKQVCQTANKILQSNQKWNIMGKNERGEIVSHRFTDASNWQVDLMEDGMGFYFKNITRPSASVFSYENFGRPSKYDYDPAKDVYDGEALAVWIDQGEWFDLKEMFKEMARIGGRGKINPNKNDMRRYRIPFRNQTNRTIANSDLVRNAIIQATNKNR